MADPDFVPHPVQDSDVFAKNQLWLQKLKDNQADGAAISLTPDADFSVSEWSGNWSYDWAPDSRRIVFAHQERPGLDYWTKAQLSIADVETKEVRSIDAGNEHWKYFPRYSPDGKWIAFINAPGPFKWSFLWDIRLFPVGGGDVVDLHQSKNRLPFPWEWASDSQSLYYIENDRVTYSFYTMPIDGSPYSKVFGSPQDLGVPGLNTYLTSSYVDVSSSGDKVTFIGQTHVEAKLIKDVRVAPPGQIGVLLLREVASAAPFQVGFGQGCPEHLEAVDADGSEGGKTRFVLVRRKCQELPETVDAKSLDFERCNVVRERLA